MAANTPHTWVVVPNTSSAAPCAGTTSLHQNPPCIACADANKLVISSSFWLNACYLHSTITNVSDKPSSFKAASLNEGDTNRCSKLESAHQGSMENVLELLGQLLGDSGTRSYNTRYTDWDDEDDTMAIDAAHSMAIDAAHSMAIDAAHSMAIDAAQDETGPVESGDEGSAVAVTSTLSTPPRTSTTAKTCPGAPKRPAPPIRLVPADELGKY